LLDGHLAVEAFVIGLPYYAHAASAELAGQAVAVGHKPVVSIGLHGHRQWCTTAAARETAGGSRGTEGAGCARSPTICYASGVRKPACAGFWKGTTGMPLTCGEGHRG